jgi:hypothetical protein
MSETIIRITAEELQSPSEELYRNTKKLIESKCQQSQTLEEYLPWKYAQNNFSQDIVDMVYGQYKAATPYQTARALAELMSPLLSFEVRLIKTLVNRLAPPSSNSLARTVFNPTYAPPFAGQLEIAFHKDEENPRVLTIIPYHDNPLLPKPGSIFYLRPSTSCLKSNINELPGKDDFSLLLKHPGEYLEDLLSMGDKKSIIYSMLIGKSSTVHVDSFQDEVKSKTMIAAALLGTFNVNKRARKFSFLSTQEETGEFDLYNLTHFFPLNLKKPRS